MLRARPRAEPAKAAAFDHDLHLEPRFAHVQESLLEEGIHRSSTTGSSDAHRQKAPGIADSWLR
jgi:hypothetical protein